MKQNFEKINQEDNLSCDILEDFQDFPSNTITEIRKRRERYLEIKAKNNTTTIKKLFVNNCRSSSKEIHKEKFNKNRN